MAEAEWTGFSGLARIPAIYSFPLGVPGEEIIRAFRNGGRPLYRGLHSRIELIGANVALLNSIPHVKRFLLDLCAHIDMQAFGLPQVHEFGVGELKGVTGNQFLYTSNEGIHCWPYDEGASIDVYSCAEYDPYDAADFCKRYFEAEGYEMDICLRAKILYR